MEVASKFNVHVEVSCIAYVGGEGKSRDRDTSVMRRIHQALTNFCYYSIVIAKGLCIREAYSNRESILLWSMSPIQ